MHKHITSEIEAAADAQLAPVTDAVAAAVQFVRAVAEDHAAHRAKTALKLPFEAEKKAATVDGAITSAAEYAAAEYVHRIARGEGPPERQQFSLGNQLTWNPGRVLPQFLFQGKPILLTDSEQVARWDRLAKQEAQENAPGPMAQIFKAQRKAAPPDIAAELERLAEGKIVFQNAHRPGWDKVIYYRTGEKGAAERLADILHNNQELTDQQQAEVWRLEGWPEADVTRELERMRHVQRMHDESWWTPPPSLIERARQYAKNLLSFSQPKETAPTLTKAEREPAQWPLRHGQRSLEQAPAFAESAPISVAAHAEAENIGDQTDLRTTVHADLDRGQTNGDAKNSAGVTRKDEPILRWLDAAMEDVHRYTQAQPRSLKRKY